MPDTHRHHGQRILWRMESEPSSQPERLLIALVADDSEALRTRLALLVRQIRGVSDVVQASSAAEVMECLSLVRPFVALVDAHMDDRGACELMRRIKKEFPNTVLIALIRYAGSQLAAVFQDCGAEYCFDKTTELKEVFQTVEQLIQKAKSHNPQKETP